MSSTIFFLLLAGLAMSVMADYTGKVLLVSMDGFRYDYLDIVDTPNFDDFARHGVKLPYMNNSFLTKTFPNHYTMVTGLHEESHGIIENHMYDPVFNSSFSMRTHEPRWWNGGEPLWVTAKNQGLKTGTYYWPGSEVEIRHVRPDHWRPYSDDTPYKERVDTVIDWLKNKGVSMATLYYPEPDHTGHVSGPDSQAIKDKVKYMDSILGYLVQKMKDNGLEDEVNVIVTSDHGMTSISNQRSLDLQDYLNKADVVRIPSVGPVAHVQPVEGREDAVFEALRNVSHITAYRKKDIPDHFHYKNNRRIMPIVLIADEGWMIYDTVNKKSELNGTHGYDNRLMTMKPIFLAKGPNFKTNFTSDPIRNVDIYPLVCKLLKINPAPNNGSLARVNAFILETPPVAGSPINAPVLLFECLLVFTVVANYIL
ncbi:ectonucleotide pyrophosphatase/phosphodiesterase family member 5-like [Haliotis rubra]|uniref:ectonucleotide pyrophosphatase/phosphodiesterase family member 5-like n=1 Tax=Haliotis rubra TaxID=36100 RepID=UPI001EE5A9AF|nr:ectonucleotide pyrophosphatase/phosphodiesterase family member 5-like [Haliotis rubra]XP_046545221.1 ectonucleotide pyrophosphatase/phosphodiesterase family member 5-like [Haliotis rubra]